MISAKSIIKSMDWPYWRKQGKGLIALAVGLFFTASANANPEFGNVAAGTVTVQQTQTTTTVTQQSQKAIINWKSFDIGANESTHFQQPQGGVALNRITPGANASQIFGKLTATGQIILVNPAGIYFGPSAYVNVGGLIATTANITDQNFLNGVYHFEAVPGYSGSITNAGQLIAAEHGLIALAAPTVTNSGMIQADRGTVALASGKAFTMAFDPNGLVNFTVDEKATTGGGVTQTRNGSLIADGGRVLVTAQAAEHVLDNVINLDGIVQARSVSQHNGEIIISGDANAGVVRVAAKVNATGKGVNETGGNVAITGYNLLVDRSAVIDTSGTLGGGNINIGGDAHGAGPLPNANAVVMMPGASLLANADQMGNGGNVVLWSNFYTNAAGSIAATGGSEGGHGGFVETSSHNVLNINGLTTDLSAAHGTMGEWLLDPSNVTIQSNAGVDSNDSYSGGIYAPTSGSTTSIIDITNLVTALTSSNVTVTTTNSGTAGGSAGTITVNDGLTWTSSNTLTLNAASTITINAGITAVNGGLVLAAGSGSAITTGTLGTIDVKNFNITSGLWSQIGTLPAFSATNFELNSGNGPNANVGFIRATSGNGTSGTPYVITDVYGLQGIGSNSTTLADYWNLGGNIDASGTSGWNGGAGFVPIGNSTVAFTGALNGNNYTINKLYENVNLSNIGLFGFADTGIANAIQNLGLTNVSITGSANNAGGIVGLLYGGGSNVVINNDYVTGTIHNTGGGVNAGGLIGGFGADNSATMGIVQDSYNAATVTGGGFYDGGIVGGVSGGTFSNLYNIGAV